MAESSTITREGFSFLQPQRGRLFEVLRHLGKAAIRTQKISEHGGALAAQNECLRAIEAPVTEVLAVGVPADPTALAKLAEIPPAGSEERLFWLEAAEQHGFEETSEEQLPYLALPAYCSTEEGLLALMAAARKQGQRDVLTAPATDGDGWEPIETADPPLDDVSVDLPGDAREGLGWAVCDISGEFAYHTWWAYEGNGFSRVTHWRRPIAGPKAALATGGARG